jgi:hypothetical protein
MAEHHIGVRNVKLKEKMKIHNLIMDFRKFLSSQHARNTFRIGNDALALMLPIIEKPSPLVVVKTAFGIGNLVMSEMEMWPDDYFDASWDCPYDVEFLDIVYGVLQHMPHKAIVTSEKTLEIRIITCVEPIVDRNIRIAYVFNTSLNKIDRLCVPLEDVEAARRLIKDALWRSLRNDNIVLRRRKSRPGIESFIGVEIDDAFHSMPSRRASEHSKYLKRCIDAGVGRSVMLYGPPGTGKSTMARTIVDSLGMRSFRIRVEDIGHIETSVVFEAIDVFQPDAIILDDFDRASEQSSLMETLEYFHKHVKLIIATVNNRNALDEAILRPGRFDELIHVKQMDEDVVKSVLGEEHGDAYPVVKEWPIAFIQEYIKRRRFMSSDEAEASIKELATRVQRLESYDDQIEKMIKVATEGDGGIGEIFATHNNQIESSLKIFKNIKKGRRRIKTD